MSDNNTGIGASTDTDLCENPGRGAGNEKTRDKTEKANQNGMKIEQDRMGTRGKNQVNQNGTEIEKNEGE